MYIIIIYYIISLSCIFHLNMNFNSSNTLDQICYKSGLQSSQKAQPLKPK